MRWCVVYFEIWGFYCHWVTRSFVFYLDAFGPELKKWRQVWWIFLLFIHRHPMWYNVSLFSLLWKKVFYHRLPVDWRYGERNCFFSSLTRVGTGDMDTISSYYNMNTESVHTARFYFIFFKVLFYHWNTVRRKW